VENIIDHLRGSEALHERDIVISQRRSISQKTLNRSITCEGIGLHSGASIKMTLHPSKVGTGIVFFRSDIGKSGYIPARWENVTETTLATTISNVSGVSVGTVEHLMAGLAGCGIDNLLIEIDGPEVPAMDGSAAPFIALIEAVGARIQNAPKRAIKIKDTVQVSSSESFIKLSPSDTFGVSFEIDFDKTSLARQSLNMPLMNGAFKKEIASARTFGFASDVEAMRNAGLALGGSLDNAIVIADDTILNKGGLRYENEFVRHKILDCVGDLYLAGAPILGKISAYRSGHSLNHALLRSLFKNEDAWSYEDLKTAVTPGTAQN
jgi:UDP-3-O-[3-hydroxymyristoyl] N-acetylglucosamine deacetylase